MTLDAPSAPALAGDFVVGDWLVRPSLSRMWQGETVVRLRPQLVDLLVCLARQPNRTLTKAELLDTVWPGQYILESGLARCVTEVRQALGDQAQNPRYIETIPKRGYRLIAPVRWLDPAESAGLLDGAPLPATPAPPPATEAPGPVAEVGSTPEPPAADQAPGPAPVVPAAVPADGTSAGAPSAAVAAVAVAEPGRRRLVGYLLAGLACLLIAAIVLGVIWRSRPRAALPGPGAIVVTFDNSTRDPAFDGALGLALAIQLEQSPVLTVLPDSRLKDELRFMGRPAGEPVTRPLALEACQRAGAKALLAGTIAALGARYVIGLEGVACQSGAAIVREQIEIERKEDVLAGVGRAASRIRERLGESLASIRDHEVPIIQATTASLDALKAVSLGDAERAAGRDAQAIALYRQAIDLDANFALAYARLASHLLNLDRTGEAVQALRRAFALSGRVSVPERYNITGLYYSRVVRDPFRAIEAFQTWRDLYPRDPLARMGLAALYNQTGRFDQALEEARAAERLDGNHAMAKALIIEALAALGRWEEGRRIGQALAAQDRANANIHLALFEMAFVLGDADGMRREEEWAAGNKTAESALLRARALAAAVMGQMREAAPMWHQASELARARGDTMEAALVLLEQAEANALIGLRREASTLVGRALAASQAPEVQLRAASVLGLSGDPEGARRLADASREKEAPDPSSDPELRPLVAALIELERGHPDAAVEALAALRPFEAGTRFGMRQTLVRGLAFERAGRPADAAAEFRRITERRAILALDPIYPAAHLHLGRTLAAAGDAAGAARANQALLSLWKTADPDLPALQAVRRAAK